MIINTKLFNANRFSLLFLSVILCFGTIVIPVLADSSYQSSLAKGTDFFTINAYNTDKWSDTFMDSILPTTYFSGDSNITGAESKATTRGFTYINLDFYGILTNFFFPGTQLATLMTLGDYGYNESEINILYHGNYPLWYGLQAVWFFTTSEFAESPNATSNSIFVFRNPSQFKDVLEQYNEFIDTLRNDTLIPVPIRTALINYTSDEFLINLAFSGLSLGIPTVSYLDALITELNPVNATSLTDPDGSPILIFNGYSKTNYSLEFKYGTDGTLSEFRVKDQTGYIIYLITSYNTEGIFYIGLFSITGVMAILIGLYLYTRKKRLTK